MTVFGIVNYSVIIYVVLFISGIIYSNGKSYIQWEKNVLC